MPKRKDNLFLTENPDRFEFNETVVRVFDDMLGRSVPLYKECLELTVRMAKHFARPKQSVYDLGCSTGTLLARLAKELPESSTLVGVDNSPDMLKKARRKLKHRGERCQLIEADLEDELDIVNACVVVMNYTLQFVPPKRRGKMLKSIRAGLSPGGVLIVIEKIVGNSEQTNDLFIDEHHRFKEQHGYSKLEIARKRQALEQVLVPLTAEKNERALKRAGFSEVETFFRWCNFAGWIAIK